MTETAPPTIIRASALTWHSDCPKRGNGQLFSAEVKALGYRSRQLDRSIAGVTGTAVHRAAEFTLAGKIGGGSPPPVSDATDAARDSLVEQMGQGVAFDTTTATRADALRQVISMTRLYYHKVAPNIQPVLVEKRLEAEVSEGIILAGSPDVVAIEPGQIDDLKTGARDPGNHNPQIGAYSLLARSAGIDIQQGAIDFIKRVPVSKPQPDPVRIVAPLAIAEQTAMNVLRHIVDDVRVFREGDDRLGLKAGDPAAFLANPHSRLCGEKYCPFWGITGQYAFCNEWRKSE